MIHRLLSQSNFQLRKPRCSKAAKIEDRFDIPYEDVRHFVSQPQYTVF